jgi:hypothetical protein
MPPTEEEILDWQVRCMIDELRAHGTPEELAEAERLEAEAA